jgi:hypothetical protein
VVAQRERLGAPIVTFTRVVLRLCAASEATVTALDPQPHVVAGDRLVRPQEEERQQLALPPVG